MPSVASRSPDASPDVRVKRKRSVSFSSASDTDDASSASRSPPPRRRKAASPSPTPSRSRSRSPPARKEKTNGDPSRALMVREEAEKLKRTEAKGEELRQQLAKLSNTRGGGAYIPPARLKALMAEAAAADPGSVEFQRMSWDALKKSVTGLVNKVAAENIKFIVPELFGGANLIRGRGLFCRSIMKAQAQSLPFTPVFAALASIVNTKLPMVGELLVTRLVSQFRRSFKRNDKTVCNATAMFIAHLVNQRVVHEILALEILVLLLEKPTDDSVEVAVSFMREVGAFLAEESPKANNSIYDRFRAVLYEGAISKRVQFMIEVLSQVRKEKYKDNPRIQEALDLVEEDDQITHQISLDDDLNVEESLNVFKADPAFVENEEKYREIKAEILGENSDSEAGSDDESGDDEDSEGEDEDDEADEQAKVDIQDKTETNLVNLRRTIYLTIMSSAGFEEAVHKLMKLNIPEGQEIELCNMIIECCSQERTFNKFYANIGERLCKLNRTWSECYEVCFRNYYDTIHRYETNRLRNIARFFGSIVAADAISWACFSIVHMTEEDTTSSSRIFFKILIGEMKEKLGMKALVDRFKEPTMQEYYVNMMPKTDPKSTRFAINFYTSIGIPQITDDMREQLKIVRDQALAKTQMPDDSSSSDSDSSLSSSSDSSSLSSSSISDSDSYYSRRRRRARSDTRTPPRQATANRPRRDAFSPERSLSPRPRRRDRSLSDSHSPPPRRRRSPTDSRSPPPRRRGRSPSDSRSPVPARKARSPTDSRSPPSRRKRSPSISRSPPPVRRRYDDDDGHRRRRSPTPPPRGIPPRDNGYRRR
ncbi:MIF4G-domain-containing protein [Acaromyces ingoldii]|uniref:MIF4G-domain-containing protein n=1 Tax=Acaromyces ingoldii TaxID=215250 RepID=A0A316YQS9_9BASI|nr:MIF4G-domain-containing protein [Acaromyces ingoldii]PWN91639.1 MIF4G-domain-containing protein [Acaromyces ingoldii]